MKKIKKITGYKSNEVPLSKLEDPRALYAKTRQNVSLKDLSYNDFKKLADKAPFSLTEWADILHVSERTLQRYAKDNHKFAPINAERFTLIEKVLAEGKKALGNYANFYAWIKEEPYMLEGNLSLNSLTTYDGIQNVVIQLNRIQHGLFA